MGKELRLAFAMGGGVSLGTFSGAALSEAIKLAVLRGRDADGQRYDRVVVDVLSGASAGSLALALMLRTLARCTPEQEAAADARLREQFGDEIDHLDDDARRDLVAAQVVQDRQRRVWVHDADLRRLLGRRPGHERDIGHGAGLLDRRTVEELVQESFFDGEIGDGPIAFSERRLLAPRVLFALTLTRLTPLLVDARGELPAHELGFLGLADGLTSRGHDDLRIFDLCFEPIAGDDPFAETERPGRWWRYHAGEERDGRVGDLRSRRAWARIGATAVASGAFPIAFEPVVLNRRDFEYGERWPEELAAAGHDEYPFTYVDGGLLNNEPIREAFRLAAFVDAGDPPAGYDRRVLFVDPWTSELATDYRLPHHQRFALHGAGVLDRLRGPTLERRTTLDRLVPYALTLGSAIFTQAKGIEADKVYQTRHRFELRSQLRRRLAAVLADAPPAEALAELGSFCTGILDRDRREASIPAGALTLAGELRRVVAEEEALPDELAAAAGAFVDDGDLGPDPGGGHWLRALAAVALDLLMDLEGKRENALLVAISPVLDPGGDEPRPIELPGRRLFGFGGFTSPIPGELEVRVARHCARVFLEAAGMIRAVDDDEPPALELTAAEEELYRSHLQEGLRLLGERLGDAIERSHLFTLVPGLDQLLLGLVARPVERAVQGLGQERSASRSYELRVEVPDRSFELDDRRFGDRDLGPLRLDAGPFTLVTFADFDPETGGWSGEHVETGALAIGRDGPGPFGDRRFCTLELPPAELLEAADLLPHPVFRARITAEDEGNELPVERWLGPEADVRPLEETLLGAQ